MTITMTKAEFDKFWAEVLGADWYIDEWNVADEAYDRAQPHDTLVIEYCSPGWQGNGQPDPTDWITSRDLVDGPSFTALVKRWRKGQTVRTVAVEVPVDKVAELSDAVERLGGRVVSGA